MEILLALVVGTLNIVCFFIGAKVGQTVVKGESIELPEINPLNIIREREERKAAEEEQNRIDTIMRNIERYDGTESHQEDVPR